jgi:hypothetical protein
MADQWYFAWDKRKFGPYSGVQLKQLAVQGRIQPHDTVWKNAIEQGVAADQVKNLFPHLQAETPPAAASATVAYGLSSPPQPSEVFAGLIPNEAAQLEQVHISIDGQGTAAAQLQETPVELLLQVIPGQSDSTPLSAPATKAPGTETIEQGTPETSPASTKAADLGPKSPAVPGPNQPGAQKKANKKGRATAMRGATVVSQDGEFVKYRKKCIKCGNEDSCTRAMPIKNGITRENYYCPKCKKSGEVVIHGHM